MVSCAIIILTEHVKQYVFEKIFKFGKTMGFQLHLSNDFFICCRHDYPVGEQAGFKNIMDHGVHAKSFKPVFPSLSFTNYYSIATGRSFLC